MVDKYKLFSIANAHGDKRPDIAKALNISESALSAKMNGWRDRSFTVEEAGVLIKRYGLSGNDVVDIFFAE